jgi:hypothetical protein
LADSTSAEPAASAETALGWELTFTWVPYFEVGTFRREVPVSNVS